MLMICNKANICGIDCADKEPHEEEWACPVECDWGGNCIPYIELDGVVEESHFDNGVRVIDKFDLYDISLCS